VMMPWTGTEPQASEEASRKAKNWQRSEMTGVRLRAEAALEVWAAASARAGTTAALPVAAEARRVSAPTAVGELRFDEAGDALVPSYVPSIWRNGGWKPLNDRFSDP